MLTIRGAEKMLRCCLWENPACGKILLEEHLFFISPSFWWCCWRCLITCPTTPPPRTHVISTAIMSPIFHQLGRVYKSGSIYPIMTALFARSICRVQKCYSSYKYWMEVRCRLHMLSVASESPEPTPRIPPALNQNLAQAILFFLSCQIRKCAGRRCSSVDALSANDTVGHAEQELSG